MPSKTLKTKELTDDLIVKLKAYFVARGATIHEPPIIGLALFHTQPYVFYAKVPVEHVEHVFMKNLIGRLRHFFSDYRALPFMSFQKGSFARTYIVTRHGDILVLSRQVNRDGSPIDPEGIVFSDYVPPYRSSEK